MVEVPKKGGRSLGDGGPAEGLCGAGLEGGRALCRQECAQWCFRLGHGGLPPLTWCSFPLMCQTKPWCLGSLVVSVSALEDVTFQLEEKVPRSGCTYFPPSQFTLLQPRWWHLSLSSPRCLLCPLQTCPPSSSCNPREALPWDGTGSSAGSSLS